MLTGKRFFHFGGELRQCERLGQEDVLFVPVQVLLKRISGIARHEDNLQARVALAQLFQQRRTIHLRHDHIADDDVDNLVELLRKLDGLLTTFGLYIVHELLKATHDLILEAFKTL